MPWKTTYGAQGAEICFSQLCTGDDILDAHESIYRHRYPEGLHYIVADFVRVDFLEISLADLLRIAEHDRQYLLRNPAHCLAMIAPQAQVVGLLRAYQEYMQGSNLRATITATRHEALTWLRAELLEPIV